MKWMLCFVLCLLSASCSMVYLFIPLDGGIGKDANGRSYVKDSRGNWVEFTNNVEQTFQKELRGEEFWNRQFNCANPPQTYPEMWEYSIQRIRSGDPVLYENPKRLIDYIHQRREELGLPPIE